MNVKHIPNAILGLAIVSVIGFTLVGTPARAEMVATPLRGDARLVQFPFDQDNTYLVLSKPKAVTLLQFAADETIQSVAAGDTQNWEFTPTKNRKNIFVKPKFEDLETSVTVLTNKRTYQFVLQSTGDGRKWYQRVNWLYSTELVLETDDAGAETPGVTPIPAGKPGPGAINQERADFGIKPEDLRFGYEVEGDAPFRPTVVYDNGKFTYFVLPTKLQELPALFTVVDNTDFAMVDYTVSGNQIVAQRLVDMAILKLGKQEVRVTRRSPESNKTVFDWKAR